jgi:hypothetical protein
MVSSEMTMVGRGQINLVREVKHAVHDAAEHDVRRIPRHRCDRPTALRATERERRRWIHHLRRLLSRRMAASGDSPTFFSGSVNPISRQSMDFGSGAPNSTFA